MSKFKIGQGVTLKGSVAKAIIIDVLENGENSKYMIRHTNGYMEELYEYDLRLSTVSLITNKYRYLIRDTDDLLRVAFGAVIASSTIGILALIGVILFK